MAIVIKNTMGIQICESRLIEASLFLRVHSPESRLRFLSEEPTRADDADEDGDDDEEARRMMNERWWMANELNKRGLRATKRTVRVALCADRRATSHARMI